MLVGGFLVFNKKLKIQGEKKEEIKRINKFTEGLQEVRLQIEQIKNQTTSIYKKLVKEKKNCLKYTNVDYSTLPLNDKEQLGALVNNAKSLSMLLGKTLEESK